MHEPESPASSEARNLEPRFVIEAPAGGLLGALVVAFIRSEYPLAPLRSVATSAGEAVSVRVEDGETNMIVVPSDPDPTSLARMATTGRTSVVCLDSSPEELRTAMRRLLTGEAPFLSPSLVRILAVASLRAGEAPSRTVLTQRETEIVRLLTLGLSNQEMANHLSVSTNTVRAHLQAISTKLGVTGRTRVIARTRELRLF